MFFRKIIAGCLLFGIISEPSFAGCRDLLSALQSVWIYRKASKEVEAKFILTEKAISQSKNGELVFKIVPFIDLLLLEREELGLSKKDIKLLKYIKARLESASYEPQNVLKALLWQLAPIWKIILHPRWKPHKNHWDSRSSFFSSENPKLMDWLKSLDIPNGVNLEEIINLLSLNIKKQLPFFKNSRFIESLLPLSILFMTLSMGVNFPLLADRMLQNEYLEEAIELSGLESSILITQIFEHQQSWIKDKKVVLAMDAKFGVNSSPPLSESASFERQLAYVGIVHDLKNAGASSVEIVPLESSEDLELLKQYPDHTKVILTHGVEYSGDLVIGSPYENLSSKIDSLEPGFLGNGPTIVLSCLAANCSKDIPTENEVWIQLAKKGYEGNPNGGQIVASTQVNIFMKHPDELLDSDTTNESSIAVQIVEESKKIDLLSDEPFYTYLTGQNAYFAFKRIYRVKAYRKLKEEETEAKLSQFKFRSDIPSQVGLRVFNTKTGEVQLFPIKLFSYE